MDLFYFHYLNNWAGVFPWWDAFGKFFASGLIWVMLILLIVLFAFRATRQEQRHEFATILVAVSAGLFAYVTNYLVSLVYFRPRPFVDLVGVHLLITKEATEKSFPSDHAALAFALAVAVFLAHRRWGIVFLVLATLVAIGRVFVGVHYPSDVIVGAVVGSVWASLVCHYGRGGFERLLKARS